MDWRLFCACLIVIIIVLIHLPERHNCNCAKIKQQKRTLLNLEGDIRVMGDILVNADGKNRVRISNAASLTGTDPINNDGVIISTTDVNGVSINGDVATDFVDRSLDTVARSSEGFAVLSTGSVNQSLGIGDSTYDGENEIRFGSNYTASNSPVSRDSNDTLKTALEDDLRRITPLVLKFRYDCDAALLGGSVSSESQSCGVQGDKKSIGYRSDADVSVSDASSDGKMAHIYNFKPVNRAGNAYFLSQGDRTAITSPGCTGECLAAQNNIHAIDSRDRAIDWLSKFVEERKRLISQAALYR